VMEGSVRYANERVRITMQLIDAETDEHLWAETYDREFADIFAIESDIAMNVANALEAEFSLEEQASVERVPTESPAAYDLYLRTIGNGAADPSGARTLLTQAIGLDPNFGLAYARLAGFYALRLVQILGDSAVEPEERENLEAEVRRLAEEALRLDPNNGHAHATLAGIDGFYWRWSETQQALERALAAYPNDTNILQVYARLRSFQGNHDDAIQLMQRVVELDPTASPYYVLASVLAHAGQQEAALNPARRAVELGPASPITHLWLARIESALDNTTEAANHLRIAEQLMGSNLAPVGLSSIAFTYSRIGYEEDALRVLEQLEVSAPDRELDAGNWVLGYLVLGDYDNAFKALQTVVNRVKNNEPDRAYYLLQIIKSNAQAHPVLDEPRFRELRGQIGPSD
jgi:adenylate cyclase